MNNAPVIHQDTAPISRSMGFDLSPQSFEQAVKFSEMLADSDLVPKDFKGKPGNCLIAMQWGSEIGLKPLQSLQNLAIINGRPSLWGDAVLALVVGSAVCEYVVETDDGTTATCRAKRKGAPEQIRTFSVEDAKQAGLHGKTGPWTQYPKRMRQMRARAFALRDVFADVLRGMPVAEEVMDMPTEKHMGTAEVAPPAALPAMDGDAWAKAVANCAKGFRQGKSLSDAVGFYSARHTLSAEQIAEIEQLYAQNAPVEAAATTKAEEPQSMSFAQVADAIHKAQDADALDMARGFIQAVPDAGMQAELHQKAAQKLAQIQQTS